MVRTLLSAELRSQCRHTSTLSTHPKHLKRSLLHPRNGTGTVQRLESRKTPVFVITPEVLKYGGETMIDWLYQLINIVWKTTVSTRLEGLCHCHYLQEG